MINFSQHLGRHRTPALVVGALVAVGLVGSAQAITETSFKYTSPQKGHVAISSFGLSPDGNGSAADFFISYGSSTLTGTGCYNTDVQLPDGAILKKLTVSSQSAATSDVSVRLVASNFSVSGTTTQLLNQTIADDTNVKVVRKFALGDIAVDTNTSNYGFAVCVGSGDIFYGARVEFTYADAGY